MKMSKKDLVLILSILVLIAASFFVMRKQNAQDAGSVRVTVDGVESGVYPLNQDDEISINDGTNTIVIADGEVNMVKADCPDHICVDHKPISKNGESIICLPNKVVVEIISSKEMDFDVMTE